MRKKDERRLQNVSEKTTRLKNRAINQIMSTIEQSIPVGTANWVTMRQIVLSQINGLVIEVENAYQGLYFVT